MAKLTMDIPINFDIDRSTAEACLKIVEIYMNRHSYLDIVGDRVEDGTLKFTFVNKYPNGEGADNEQRKAD